MSLRLTFAFCFSVQWWSALSQIIPFVSRPMRVRGKTCLFNLYLTDVGLRGSHTMVLACA